MKKILVFIFCCFLSASVFPQEALKSVEEEYYSFLALQGLAERPYLNYRTLSDSVWTAAEDAEHPWQGLNLGRKYDLIDGRLKLKIYGPELFTSFNTAVPYGQNDGALWQGRGFNAGLSGGARLEGYGVELTFKPQLAFSQNWEFDIMPSVYESEYGYFWGYGVDAPQRFGNDPFFVYDWGDSEIRYTWKTLTVGFGTQAVWLGPSYLNSMLHSNNAPTYPKLDIGLRRQRVTLPWLDWYIGDVEARLWVGYLSESDYFDNDDSNDHTMFHGLAAAYAPSFLPGLTLFANRVCLVAWEWENLRYMFPKVENTIEDQKASIGASWNFPLVGFEVYGELGVDDYASRREGFQNYGYVYYPFHTMLYTVGLKKTIPIIPTRRIFGELIFEWNSMEMSQDFQFHWPYSPYFHHNAIHGYTNRGQWLGAGSGWGGSSQYLEFKLYYPKGTSSLFVHRNNPDNNFLYGKAVSGTASEEMKDQYYHGWKANLNIGVYTNYSLLKFLSIGGGITYNYIVNPNYFYTKKDSLQNEFMHNVSIQFTAEWNLK